MAEPDRTSAGPAAVRLHLHRGIGWGLYGTATALVLALVLVGTVSYLVSGRYVMATVTVVAGLALTAFLAVVTYALVVPDLTADPIGIRGRMPRGNTVEAPWDAITIDVDDDARPGTIRLDIAEESVSVNSRSWVGVEDFVLLVGSTPDALDRLTPAALHEWIRLLGGPQELPGPTPA